MHYSISSLLGNVSHRDGKYLLAVLLLLPLGAIAGFCGPALRAAWTDYMREGPPLGRYSIVFEGSKFEMVAGKNDCFTYVGHLEFVDAECDGGVDRIRRNNPGGEIEIDDDLQKRIDTLLSGLYSAASCDVSAIRFDLGKKLNP